MKLKAFYISIILIICACSPVCSQVSETDVLQQFNTLYKDVKHTDSAIYYKAYVDFGNCTVEYFINDVLIYRNDICYDSENDLLTMEAVMSLEIDINDFILHPGKQTWELRVHPPYLLDTDKRLAALPEKSRMEFSIYSYGKAYKYLGETTLFETPLRVGSDGKEIFADAGKPYISYTGTFDAEVPYTLTGWSESEDLTQIDPEELKTMLVNEYESLGKLIQKGNMEQSLEKIFQSEKDRAQYRFYDKEKNSIRSEEIKAMWGNPEQRVQPLENYEMIIGGNGRLVTLQCSDRFMWGEPALMSLYPQDGGETYRMFRLFFHMPKGSSELELIR